jgi:hypothetical protein
MTSAPIRDPLADHLITPQNAAFIVIDYQQNQFGRVGSMDSDLLLENVVRMTQAGAQPISWVSLAGELQRDWARVETVPGVVEIVFTDRLSTA